MAKTNKTEKELERDQLLADIASKEDVLAVATNDMDILTTWLAENRNLAARLALEIEQESIAAKTSAIDAEKKAEEEIFKHNKWYLENFHKNTYPELEHLREEYERKGWIKAKGKKVVKEAAAASSNGAGAAQDDNWDI